MNCCRHKGNCRSTQLSLMPITIPITVPPKQLFIVDSNGKQLEGLIGPFDEFSDLTLMCIAQSGKEIASNNTSTLMECPFRDWSSS